MIDPHTPEGKKIGSHLSRSARKALWMAATAFDEIPEVKANGMKRAPWTAAVLTTALIYLIRGEQRGADDEAGLMKKLHILLDKNHEMAVLLDMSGVSIKELDP